jgi:putative serine protease PepD
MYRLGIGGDLITAIDGIPVSGPDSLRRAVNGKKAGDRMELTIVRNGRTQKVPLTLGAAAEAL